VNRLESEEKELKSQYDQLTKRDAGFRQLITEQRAAEDLRAVLDHAISVLLGETIDDVSRRLNELFMSMIALSPEAASEHGVVREVSLTRTCDIKVSGPGGEDMRPRTDISGAQQQALTVALIMALIEVSGDASPMVIDTPLGMTSGDVRTHFLSETLGLAHLEARTSDDTAITPQRILLMTPQEILGVEELLERAAGKTWTLTNSQHFPSQLVNDPGTNNREVLICGCGPRQTDYCVICQRKDWN
jgi:DNA sulfur modification protein DndD